MHDRRRPRPRHPALSSGFIAVLTMTFALTACGSSGNSSDAKNANPTGSSTSASANGRSGESTAPTVSSGSGGVNGDVVNVCDLLPAADMAKLSGLPLTKAEKVDLPTPGIPIAKCKYTSKDGTQGIGVTTHQTGNTDAAKQAMSERAGIMGGKKVPGVGDSAYYSPALGVGGLSVLYGTREIDVSATQEIQQNVTVKIAEALHAKL